MERNTESRGDWYYRVLTTEAPEGASEDKRDPAMLMVELAEVYVEIDTSDPIGVGNMDCTYGLTYEIVQHGARFVGTCWDDRGNVLLGTRDFACYSETRKELAWLVQEFAPAYRLHWFEGERKCHCAT